MYLARLDPAGRMEIRDVTAAHVWKQLADQLHRAGYSYGYVKAVVRGRLVWLVDASKDGHRYAVRASPDGPG